MTLIPDHLPEPRALANAVPKHPGKKGGDTSFVRVMDRLRQVAPLSGPGSVSSGGAEVFNERGFFQPPVSSPATLALNISGGDPRGENDGRGEARSVSADEPVIDRTVQMVPYCGVWTDSGIAQRGEMPVRARSPGGIVTTADAEPVGPAARSNALTSDHLGTSQPGAAIPRPRSSAATVATTAHVQVIADDTGPGIVVSVRIDGIDPSRRSTLRAAIVGLLARHGFLPRQVRINGAGDAPSQEKKS